MKRHCDQNEGMVRRFNQHDSWLSSCELLGCAGEETELEGSQTSLSIGLCYESLPFSHKRKHSALRLGPQPEDPGRGSWKGEWESLGSVMMTHQNSINLKYRKSGSNPELLNLPHTMKWEGLELNSTNSGSFLCTRYWCCCYL